MKTFLSKQIIVSLRSVLVYIKKKPGTCTLLRGRNSILLSKNASAWTKIVVTLEDNCMFM